MCIRTFVVPDLLFIFLTEKPEVIFLLITVRRKLGLKKVS